MARRVLRKGQMARGFNPKPSYNDAPKVEETTSLLEEIEQGLEKEGIKLFDNSNIMQEFLVLPADLTESENRDLGRYFNAFTKQKMWTRTLLGRVSAMSREMEIDLDEIRDRVFKGLPSKMSLKEKELSLLSDDTEGEDVKGLIRNVAKFKEKKNMLKDYLANLEDAIFNISREISRREADWKSTTRENSIDTKRRR